MAGDAAPVYRSPPQIRTIILSDFPEQSRAPQKGCNGVLRRFFISQETYGADNLQDFYLMEGKHEETVLGRQRVLFFQP